MPSFFNDKWKYCEMMDDLKIGLTFSGGGYRAATFHLGVLSYLDSVKVEEHTLLEGVTALSTISGGTITGLRYMLGLSRGESVHEIFRDLYDFLLNTDLVTLALDNLSVYGKEQQASLIRTMSGIYNRELFKGAVLGELMAKLGEGHISHFSANATDFTNGLPFRFQITEKIDGASGTPYEYGLIGNEKIQLSRETATYIRLSDILACSSCFPSGFEPMIFPSDFVWKDFEAVKPFFDGMESVGIMDGGIVDNQGMEPVLLAEQQMKRSCPQRDDKCLDLIIVSDVSSPYMDAYKPSNIRLSKVVRLLSLNKVSSMLNSAEVIAAAIFIGSLFCPVRYVSDVFFMLLGFMTMIWVVWSITKRYIVKVAGKSIIKHSISSILDLQVGDMVTLLMNRVHSVLMLTTSVFMKHIRRLEYACVYRDSKWFNRRITNTVYELRKDERWVDKIVSGDLDKSLTPSIAMQENSDKAAAMGTTLWFTPEDKVNGIPEALIAAGQYTICWNLLEYIDNIKKNPVNLNKHHQLIVACEPQLRRDWENFKKNPQLKASIL